jgi:hypothetical protein
MKGFNRSLIGLAIFALLAALPASAAMTETYTITFDNGTEGWDWNGDCEEILDDGDEYGNYLRFTPRPDCGEDYYTRSWYNFQNNTNPAFVGDYTEKGDVRISFDWATNFYLHFPFWGDPMNVEEYREIVIELRDTDNPYTDPDTGHSWPWTSVWYVAGVHPVRETGWAHYEIDVPNVHSTEMPEGWLGYGGPENPDNYEVQLPPDRTWTDVLAEVDEIHISSLNYNYFYSLDFVHDMQIDNLSIGPIPQECNGIEATVFVDADGVVHGGGFDGKVFNGVLKGSDDDDVIVGTDGDDTIIGFGGNDIICGGAGNDNIKGSHGSDLMLGGAGDDNMQGQQDNDFIDGGDGHDHLNGGPGAEDTCVRGEIVNSCGPGDAPTVVRPDPSTQTPPPTVGEAGSGPIDLAPASNRQSSRGMAR